MYIGVRPNPPPPRSTQRLITWSVPQCMPDAYPDAVIAFTYWAYWRTSHTVVPRCTANLRATILDLKGFNSSIILMFKCLNSYVHRGFPWNAESTNLIAGMILVGRFGVVVPRCNAAFPPGGDLKEIIIFTRDASCLPFLWLPWLQTEQKPPCSSAAP